MSRFDSVKVTLFQLSNNFKLGWLVLPDNFESAVAFCGDLVTVGSNPRVWTKDGSRGAKPILSERLKKILLEVVY